MIKNIDEIKEQLDSIQAELPKAFQPHIDKTKIKILSLKILDLTHETVVYLDENGLLVPWVKFNIVKLISSLNWCWLYAAVNELRLAICDPSEVSPANKYCEEIINLKADEIINHICLFKKTLEKLP